MEHLALGAPPKLPGMRLQTRDLAILSELGEVALLDTETIHRRYFADDATGQACRRRLRLLAAHGLTQTLQIGVTTTHRTGRLPTIHRLTAIGADVVAQETGHHSRRIARSDPPRPYTLLHRLGMARVVLAMNDACQLHGLAKPEWLLEYDAVPNAPPHASFAQRFMICHEFPGPKGRKISCWPDAACTLTIPRDDKNWQLAVFWEYDRSTETLVQVAEKLAGYQALLSLRAYQRYWPTAAGVRIFFVVPSAARRQNILSAIRPHPAAEAIRIAVVNDVLTPARVLAEPIWETTAGEARSIISAGQAATVGDTMA